MPKLNVDALVFSLAWAALAVFALLRSGYLAGAILSVGLLFVIMPVSSLILDRTGDLGMERLARWGILAGAGMVFGLMQALRG